MHTHTRRHTHLHTDTYIYLHTQREERSNKNVTISAMVIDDILICIFEYVLLYLFLGKSNSGCWKIFQGQAPFSTYATSNAGNDKTRRQCCAHLTLIIAAMHCHWQAIIRHTGEKTIAARLTVTGRLPSTVERSQTSTGNHNYDYTGWFFSHWAPP